MISGSAGKYARFELERRYLLDELPRGIDARRGHVIHDRYFTGTRLRLRRVDPIDGGDSVFKLSQKEAPAPPDFATTVITTIYLDEREYAALAVLPGLDLRKRRHSLEDDGVRYSIDVFQGQLDGLILAEVTFETEEQLRAHEPPPFAVRDVSTEVAYTGGSLAAHPPFEGARSAH